MSPPDQREVESAIGPILLVLAASFIFAISDAAAKFVVGRLPPLEIHWLRSTVVVLVSLPVVLWRKGPAIFRTRHPALQAVRGFATVSASLFFLTGLFYLPLADASAINFIWPLLVTVFSIVLLGERVGVRRALATLAGFIGMLVIIRPGSSAFHPAAVFPLMAAVSWAFASVITRKLSADEAAETTIVWSALIAFAVGLASMPFVFIMPTPREFGICVLIGLASSVAHAMVIVAYSRATASSLAPYSYSQLVWAAAAGVLFFGTLPDGWVITGAAIIAASGIYTVHRERVRHHEARSR